MHKSFIDIVHSELAGEKWHELDNHIIQRFTGIKSNRRLRYIGVVDWIYCSPLGAILANAIRAFAILPRQCVRNTRFEFIIDKRGKSNLKQRRYFLNQQQTPFVFESSFANTPSLHEEFRGGLGMFLKLEVKRSSLLFSDRGYFFRVGKYRLPIPRWIAVGKFELLHRSIDAKHFQILIRIAHPIFGTLFYQRGEFMKFPHQENKDE